MKGIIAKGWKLLSLFLLLSLASPDLSAQPYIPDNGNNTNPALETPQQPQKGKRAKNHRKDGKDIYAYATYHEDRLGWFGLVKFNSANLTEMEFISPENSTTVFGTACYADPDMDGVGTYYAFGMGEDRTSTVNFSTIDLETGTSTVLAEYPTSPAYFSDMDYDYSTHTLYAVSNSSSVAAIFRIDIETGATEQLAIFRSPLYTLAISMDGTMYSVGLDGNLYTLDMDTWTATPVGHTGFYPYGWQSMSFDHSDNTLLWAYFNNGMGKLHQIDLESGTATQIGNLDGNAQLIGMYVPFKFTRTQPRPATDFTIEAGSNGSLTATLSWINPDHNIDGSAIESLQKVEIFRNDTLLHTIENPAPGQAASWQDQGIEQDALYTYSIVASTDQAGMPAKETAFIGHDLPVAPAGITLSDGNGKAVLSWSPVTESQHGGYMDLSTLQYRITRMPDGIEMGTTKETDFEDASITEMASYSYIVESFTAKGKGGQAESPALILGPAIEMPYICTFNTEEEFKLWQIEDANEDGITWKSASYSNDLTLHLPQAAYGSTSDDYAYSPAFNLVSGQEYRIEFHTSWQFSYEQNTDTVSLQIGPDAAGMIPSTLATLTTQHNTSGIQEHILSYTPMATFQHKFTLHGITQGTTWFHLHDIDIRPWHTTDMLALSFDGPDHLIAGKEYQYTFLYKNIGKENATVSQIELLNQDGTVLETFAVNKETAMNDIDTLAFSYTPGSENEASGLRCRIVCTGDESETNNTSESLPVSIQPAGSADFIQIGADGATSAGPFSAYYLYSGTQSLYLQEELQNSRGMIQKISYPVIGSEKVENVALEVWMANTEISDLRENGMLPKELFTLVWQDTVSFEATTTPYEWVIELDKEFLYLGDNLVIMFSASTPKCSSIGFRGYNVFQRYSQYQSNTDPFNYESDIIYLVMPSVNIYIQQEGGSSLSGTVSALVPIEGMAGGGIERPMGNTTIHLESDGPLSNGQTLNASKTNESDGTYSFPYLLEGNYNLRAEAFGYQDYVQAFSLDEEEAKTLDFTMTALEKGNLSGLVHDGNGNPVGDASVTLSGYDTYTATTDVEGKFSIADIYLVEEAYHLQINKLRYKTHYQELTLSQNDTSIDIRLAGVSHSPSPVTATLQGENVDLQWEGVETTSLFRYDAGEAAGQIGPQSPTPYSVYGTAFRTPVIVENVSWFITEQPINQDSVNLFIFGLDENGIPDPYNVLFDTMHIRNQAGQWSQFTLQEPLECPNGCYIGLSASQFISMGLDSGEDEEYPFRPNTHYVSTNYLFYGFQTIESAGFPQNIMLRMEGEIVGSPIQYDAKELVEGKYNVYRLLEEDKANEDNWTLLNEDVLEEPGYTDNTWSSLEPGVYLYAVKALSQTNDWSEATFSNTVENAMELDVTFQVNTNTSEKYAEDALISIKHSDGDAQHQYQANTDAQGKAVLNDAWRGEYSVDITLDGFESLHESIEIGDETSFEFTLKEKIAAPYNLQAEVDGGNATLSWNTPYALEDGFEEHEDFSINSPGAIGWQYLDADGANTAIMGPASYPNVGSKMAAMIFNPSATTPALEMFEIQAYEGEKYLGFFTSINVTNNDWFISPKLDFPTPVKFSFYAKTMTPTEALERMRVGYSTTGMDTADFTWLHAEAYIEPDYSEWTLYEYELPANTAYVTINCISHMGFILMVDDVKIEMSRAENLRPSVKYEVYLDGSLKETLQGENTCTFENLANGQYTAGVKAIYETGESGMVETTFTVNNTANDELAESGLRIYPNPAKDFLYVEGEFDFLEIYDLTGRLLYRSESGSASTTVIPVRDFTSGCYLLRTESQSLKFVKD